MLKTFCFDGPLGNIECLVEPNRSKSKAVVIMSHGFRGSRESGGRAAGLAYMFAEHADVVRYNFTGTQIMSKQVAELESVVAEVRRLAPESEIYLFGRSLGGAASIIEASKDKKIKGLVLWATPNSIEETFRHVMPPEFFERLQNGMDIEFDDERGHCVLGPDFLTDGISYDLSALLSAWDKRPVLLLHCEADNVVVVEQAKRNAEILGSKGELYLFPNGDHAFTEHSDAAGALITDWLGRQINK